MALATRGRRVVVVACVAMVVLAACNSSPSTNPTGSSTPVTTAVATTAPTGTPASLATKRGGTIHLLTSLQDLYFLDPQRNYAFENLAFLGATIQRSLVAYATSPDPIAGTTMVPDMATDLGRATDGGRTWSFTLREGVTWQDGAAVTCEDVKYGVSRTFANDVINQGPTYAITYLDIPANPVTDSNDAKSAFLSAYYGPYNGTGQDLFDKAVECSADHRTITFHLKQPIGDFSSVVTLGFGAVPKAADSGETYGQSDHLPWSNGPYMVDSYTTNSSSGRLVLVRNPSWDPSTDPLRHAYPDRWEVDLGIDDHEIDRRLIASAGDDAFALPYAGLQEDAISTVYAAPDVARPAFGSRAAAGFDQYARYDWIDTTKVPNLKLRQAMQVALDRAAIHQIMGGDFAGTFADGVIIPTIGRDYAPTGIWDSFYGQRVPDSGDPELAKRLIEQSGETPPTLTFSIFDTPTNQKILTVVKESLGRAGLTVEWQPPCEGYCAAVLTNTAAFGAAGWGADWPSASTVIPPLFTLRGGWDKSMVDSPAFNAAVADATTTLDRSAQAEKWQALSRQAVENAWVIPTFFTRTQRLAGSKVGPVYLWPAYASWPYGEMYVTP